MPWSMISGLAVSVGLSLYMTCHFALTDGRRADAGDLYASRRVPKSDPDRVASLIPMG